jgi:cell filamentation protein
LSLKIALYDISVLDVVAVLNEENDYQRVRNYWKYLKAKLKKEKNQLGSATTQLKIYAPDGKKRLADLLDSEGVTALAKHFPNNKSVVGFDAEKESCAMCGLE